MGWQTSQLPEAFESVPPDEQRIFTAEFPCRVVPVPSGLFDHSETAHAGDELFGLRDAEENNAGSQ